MSAAKRTEVQALEAVARAAAQYRALVASPKKVEGRVLVLEHVGRVEAARATLFAALDEAGEQ